MIGLPPLYGGLAPIFGGNFGTTTLTLDQENVGCPSECYESLSGVGGETFGGMDLTSGNACGGFSSGYGYCGGSCYNQPYGTTPPVDCRGCYLVENSAGIPIVEQDYGECPKDYPAAYSGGNIPGSYCCNFQEYFTVPYSTDAYGSTVIDHCPHNNYVACTNPPCRSHGSLPVASAAGVDTCYPWGNSSMWPLFPFTY